MSICYVIDIGEIVLFKEKNHDNNDVIGIIKGIHKGKNIMVQGYNSDKIYFMKPDDYIDSTSYNNDDNDNDNDNDDINDDEYDSYDLNDIRIDDNDNHEMIIDDNDDDNNDNDVDNNNIIDLLKTINSYRKRNDIMKMNKCIDVLLDLIS